MIVPSVMGAQSVCDYVDPRIGSEGLGRTFIGPCCPYGMVKPGPDCGVSNNAGWAPMPAAVSGFSQTHVSGTGGGPKYGNILVAPFEGEQLRTSETVRLGYYGCSFANGMTAEVTTAERAAFYRYTGAEKVRFDLTHFLGRNPVPKAREAQQYEDSHLDVVNDSVTTGWQCISGGWNNGAPYTVYFYSLTKKAGRQLLQKIGISYVSVDKARRNMEEDIPHWSFDTTYKECLGKWEALLGRVTLGEDTPLPDKRMFYTALYHTMIMPVDRTQDDELVKCQNSKYPNAKLVNSKWLNGKNVNDKKVNSKWLNGKCYDDYYAIWDTYRTSTPLITLLDPQREEAIVQSLLNIYKKDGYMPDARSGNSNGRTQGGSNAEIVIADAVAKGLKVDKELALEAMLKDAEVPPKDDEAEGRGGLKEYNSLGYIPYGIARGGNRTVEYSFCDWAISRVAKDLKEECEKQTTNAAKKKHKYYAQIEDKYNKKSRSWLNLWRDDYEHDGAKGFIMPRTAAGEWLDSVPFGHSKLQPLKFRYTPDVSYEGPWYCAWWDCYFYEASSWEYSFSFPHDVDCLIAKCGGNDAFERRLDTFFDHGYYNVANEPSFLTPCLYHWVGKPERSSECVKRIIRDNYSDSPSGIPGNDDSGSMSSWLAFHMLGLYPNAGHDYYLVHEPLISHADIKLTNGSVISIRKTYGDKAAATFNGIPLEQWRVTHQQLMQGGELCVQVPTPFLFTYKLHGQTRRFNVDFTEDDGSLVMHWSIVRNLKTWHGSYRMSPEARNSATALSYEQPLDGQHITLPPSQLFAVLSRDALHSIQTKGECIWCNTLWKVNQTSNASIDHSTSPSSSSSVTPLQGETEGAFHLISSEGAEMWVDNNPRLPLIRKMINNPVEINWEVME